MTRWLQQRASPLALLLCLLLMAGPLLAESPWHQHEQHLADCVLCHLQGSDALPPATAVPAPQSLFDPYAATDTQGLIPRPPFYLYASRAPPFRLHA